MSDAGLAERARGAFAADLAAPPPLSLRGGNDVDGHDRATPFDPAVDQPADAYLERHALWGLIYLDAQSWRHYLPHLIAYAERHPDDPHMVVETLVRSLRPPDRYPPRLTALTTDQESAVRAFLELVVSDDRFAHLRDEAQQALDEWWGSHPRNRPSAAEIAAARNLPVTYRTVTGQGYRIEIPHALTGSGARDIPDEHRHVEGWSGLLCSDAHSVVAVNITPDGVEGLAPSLSARRELFRAGVHVRRIEVTGAGEAWRLDGLIDGNSPAEPEAFTMVVAASCDELVTLSIRTWPRADLGRVVEHIVRSLTLNPSTTTR
jgi:hypothetical protein